MAQLVKLSDYISRYEIDIYRYPSRFVRLKKERWNRFLRDFQTSEKQPPGFDFMCADEEYAERKSIRQNLKELFFHKKEDPVVEIDARVAKKYNNNVELKSAFKEEIYQFQLTWASSTISEVSDISKKYYHDSLLSYLVKNLPDSFFIFYQPVFYLKKAPVDIDILILTPTELWLITPLLGSDQTIYQSHSDRYWEKRQGEKVERLLHPALALKRMKAVVEPVLAEKGSTFKVRTAIIAKDSFIDIPSIPKRTKLIDKRNIGDWKENILRNTAPVKHQQLKLTEALLNQCLSNAVQRNDSEHERFDDNQKEL